MLDLVVLITNKKALMRLAPEQQKAVRDAAHVAAAQQRKMAEKEEAIALMDLKAKGLRFYPVLPETRVALRKAAARVLNKMKGQLGAELVDKVVAGADRADKP